MCGFAGEIRADGRSPDVRAVAAMAGTMADRGPDGGSVLASGPIAFGHRRLKIIDLSDAGAQPMRADGRVLVFNGCIYNYPALRQELLELGHRFTSTSDTEVVLRGWIEWGEDLLDRMNGMFAFVLHDERTRETVLVRDRLGIKPLYLAPRAEGLRFASTLPALLHGGGIDTELDLVALHHYLSFHAVVPPPRTILRGVRKLPPATVLRLAEDGTATQRRFWEPTHERREDRRDWTAEDWRDAILEVLTRAVDRRLVADVPVGVLLSGGLDSSLVVGLLAEAGQHGLATYSVGFEAVGGVPGDEFAYSDVIARHYGTDHHQIRVAASETRTALEPTIAAMAEPMVSHDCVGFFLLSREVAKSIKVVQSGQGADELFAGYHWYPPLRDVRPDDALDGYRRAFFDRSHAGLLQLLSPAYRPRRDHAGELVAAHMARPGAETALDRGLRVDAQVMLVDDPVKRVDNMTMAWGLEARVPFLDHEVVELAATIPPELHLPDGGKNLLKMAGRKVIPAEVIDRPKGYFPVPALTHLEGQVLDLVRDALTNQRARDRGLFEPAAVQRLLDDPNGQLTPLGGNQLWQLGLLELWLQTRGI